MCPVTNLKRYRGLYSLVNFNSQMSHAEMLGIHELDVFFPINHAGSLVRHIDTAV